MKYLFSCRKKSILFSFIAILYLSFFYSCTYRPSETVAYSSIKQLDTTPPKIIITNPQDRSLGEPYESFPNDRVVLKGYVFDAGNIKDFTINDNSVALSSENKFEHAIMIKEGGSEYSLKAVDEFGNVGKITFRTVGKKVYTKINSSKVRQHRYKNRNALVIGIGNYRNGFLKNPVNDANDIADSLENLDFSVIKCINVTRSEMRNCIRKFGDQISKGGVGLFYFAGHGIQLDGENYLVPVDAKVERYDEIPDECLMASSVLRKMEAANNDLNIIILDACRNNPFASRFRSLNRGLTVMEAPIGSLLAYSTSPGSVAMDGEGRNGVYTEKLLKHLQTPGLRLIDLFINVRNDVAEATGDRQIPWETQSLRGTFYFLPKE